MANDDQTKLKGALGGLGEKDALEALVSMLALVKALKELGGTTDPSRPRPPALRSLLFDLAQFQVRTAADLVRIGTAQADQMLAFLRDRQAPRGRGAEPCRPLPRVLVSPKAVPPRSDVTETFRIRNDAHKPREYTLPDVLELRRLGPDGLETDAVVFARAQFTPDRACVPAKGQCQVQLTIPWDPRLGDGATTRYRACVLLEADGTPAAEFIVELLYETPPTPAAAPAGASAPKGKPQK